MQDPNEILQKFKTSKFLVASRSKGLVCPLSMRLSSFDDAIGFRNIGSWSSGIWFLSGVYLVEGDGFTNVHRQIRKLFKAGPWKTLRVKENV